MPKGVLDRRSVASCRAVCGSVAPQGALGEDHCVHFARNLLQRVPKAHQGMVTAAQRSVFAHENAADILSRWDDLAVSLAERFPKAAELMNEAREEVLAFRHFPAQHWKKVWSTSLLERVNVAPRGALSKAEDKAPHPRRWHLPQRCRDHPPGWGGAVTPKPVQTTSADNTITNRRET
jgi:transposase-like protein